MTVASNRHRHDQGGAPALRVGIDATSWANPRGYGRFIRELLPRLVRLAPEIRFVAFLDERAAADFEIEADNLDRRVVRQGRSPTEAAAADSSRSPTDMLRFTRAVGREPLDAFFAPTVYTYFPLPRRLPALVGIHDAIAERFPHLTLPSPRARLFWSAKVGLARRQARLVLTVSDYAASELVRVHRIAADRIRIAPEAPSDIYRLPPDPLAAAPIAKRIGLPDGARWLVYVGGFNPHKHVDHLVLAHARLVASRADPPHLVLVGRRSGDVFHGGQAEIERAIARSGSASLVHWAGFVPDEELRHLLAAAAVSVLPSASEGFGLPAVEAAACGTPVVATTESPLPALLEGGGIFVPPGRIDELTEALRTLLDDEALRARMGAVARERALALTWDETARRTLAAIREVAA